MSRFSVRWRKKKKPERPFVKTERCSCADGSEANVPLSSAAIKRRRGRSFDLMPRCDWLSWRLGGEGLHTDVPDSLLSVILFHSHAVPSAKLFLLFPPVNSFWGCRLLFEVGRSDGRRMLSRVSSSLPSPGSGAPDHRSTTNTSSRVWLLTFPGPNVGVLYRK